MGRVRERAFDRIEMTKRKKVEACVSRQKDRRCGVRSGGVPTRRLFALGGLTLSAAWALSGCGGIFARPFTAGTYVGDLPCTLSVVDPSGATGEQD